MGNIYQIKDSDGEAAFPVTKVKAVYDDAGNRLDTIVPTFSDPLAETSSTNRDADTLGGLYSASDITSISSSLSQLEDKVGNVISYSTTEKKVGTDIDGKPLYRRTISITTPTSTNYNSISTGILNAKNCRVVDGYILGTNGWNYALNYYLDTNDRAFHDCSSDGTSIYTRTYGTYASNTTAYITLQYGKTTD